MKYINVQSKETNILYLFHYAHSNSLQCAVHALNCETNRGIDCVKFLKRSRRLINQVSHSTWKTFEKYFKHLEKMENS